MNPVVRIVAVMCCISVYSLSLFAEADKIHRAGPDKIENQYIVVLTDDVLPAQVPDVARQLADENGAELRKVWSAAIKGFSATMTEARALAMSRNPHVKYIEENTRMYLSASHATNINPVTCDPTVQTNCTAMTDNRLWHLDRADQNQADPNNTYSYCTTGNNQTIYVVDTGVVGAHAELSGRVQPGYNASGDNMPANDPCLGFALTPTGTYGYVENSFYIEEWQASGHGTAVASAAAGRRVGVAKNATIVPVKVIRCDHASARYRIPSHSYVANETMFIVDTGGNSLRGLYRALNSGTTSSDGDTSAAFINSWPVGTTQVPRPTRVDNNITWEYVPTTDWQNTETVEMVIDGLNWILGANTGPKSYAVVTLSTFFVRTATGVGSPPPDRPTSLEDAIRSLLNNNLTVIASANNQNGDACDTSPGRLSRGNPNPAIANKVITAGGTMMINQPWSASLNDPPAVPDGATLGAGGGNKGTQPAYIDTQGVREGRWICGAGDSDTCSNPDDFSTIDVSDPTYFRYNGGSNGGPCVTLFAPAKNLFLARNTGPNDYRDARLDGGLASGTSWSAPIVAGFAARLLEANGNLTPQQVYDKMMENVTLGALDTGTLNPKRTDGTFITDTPNKVLRLADINVSVPPQSTPINPSGPTTFSVTAGGTTTLSYQWYQVTKAGFDVTLYPRGAHPPNSSTAIGTNSSTLSVTPTQPTAYWVRISNSCGSWDSDIVMATQTLNPPTNVVATASGATVTISWTPASGADGYLVQRKVSSADWQDAVTVNGGTVASTPDQPTSTSGVVMYRVKSRLGTNFSVSASNNDVAWVGTFLDDPIATPPSYTTIKAQHITEVRKTVNALLDIAGQQPIYTAAAVDPNNLRGLGIDDADFTTLMTNLNNARGNFSLPAVSFRTTPAQNGLILRTQIEDLRSAVK